MKGNRRVDSVRIFGFILGALILLNIGIVLSQIIHAGTLSGYTAVLAAGLIVFFSSNTIFKWGSTRSAVFAAVFVILHIGLHTLFMG